MGSRAGPLTNGDPSVGATEVESVQSEWSGNTESA